MHWINIQLFAHVQSTLSAHLDRIPGLVLVERRMPGLSGRPALAERLRLPELRRGVVAVPRQPHPHDVQGLRASEHRDRGHAIRQDAHPAQRLAGCGLVPDPPEARRERPGPATSTRAGQLPDCLGQAAPVSSGEGATRPGASEGAGRGRRDLSGEHRSRGAQLSALGRKNNTAKALDALAVEVLEPRGLGRIRLRRIAEDSQEFVVPFVQASVEPGTQVRTDGSAA